MNPSKIIWYLGASSLAMIMEQDRRHWLMKTDQDKQVQDPITGDVFRGRIENLGSDMIMETEKLYTEDIVVHNGTFSSENVSDVFDLQKSVFAYTPMMNGLHFMRLKSINVMIETTYHNFRLVLKNVKPVYVPMAPDKTDPDEFVYKWYCTTSNPILQSMDTNGNWTIETEVRFSEGVTNPVFYYPADSVLEPIEATVDGMNQLTSNTITDPNMIGMPLIWFTCDESNIGPQIALAHNTVDDSGSLLLSIGHPGDASDYECKLFPCTGDISKSTPTSPTSDWKMVCASLDFTGDVTDSLKPVSQVLFTLKSGLPDDQQYVEFSNVTGTNRVTLNLDAGWVYDSTNHTYEIDVDLFDTNAYGNEYPLIPAFNVSLDDSISFERSTTDTGYVGIQFGSSKNHVVTTRYPHDIANMTGLPEWIRTDGENMTPQHMSLYAIHNTPFYDPGDQSTRQLAGLILDPGVERTYQDGDDVPTDEIGRVYVLSNDEPTYVNNAKTDHPKPARTAARMCDIPTSVMQLSGISGLAPTMVVDKKYVRSEAPFTEADQNYLFNGSRSHWVRPIDLGENGKPIYDPTSTTSNSNQFVFDSIDQLNRVDLMNHNDYRETENLNAKVPPSKVSVSSITKGGSDYQVGDIGMIVVGGFSFTYEVMEVGSNGQVTELEIGSNDGDETLINMANFDFPAGYSSGITAEYGTSPLNDSTGTGLKITFRIADYENYIPHKGAIFTDLFAFVRDTGGIWLMEYVNRMWQRGVASPIATTSESDVHVNDGHVSYKDAYMKSIIPTAHTFTVAQETQYALDVQMIALQTASAINVIDDTCTPVWVPSISSDTEPFDDKTWIDINKLYCRGVRTITADVKNETSALDAIKRDGGARYDSYIFWRWIQPTNTANRQLEYGVIHRSLDNLQSSDTTTFLPENELTTDKYVHTNSQTTIMWNVPHVGPMVWMFDPNSNIHEKYYVNAHTRELYVSRTNYKWNELEISDASGNKIKLSDSTGLLRYYIYTNSPAYASVPQPPNPIYQQPGFVKIASPNSFPVDSDILNNNTPIRGAWRLVFPSLTKAYKLQNIVDGREFTPVKMQILRGSNITPSGDILNDENIPVNYKTLLMNENASTGRTELSVYDQETQRWMQI